MNKSISVRIEPYRDSLDCIILRVEVHGFGVKNFIVENVKHINEFQSIFDLIWEDMGYQIKEYYLNEEN